MGTLLQAISWGVQPHWLTSVYSRKLDLIDKIQPTIEHFKNRLQGFYTLDHVGDVRVCGLAAGIELVRDRVTKEEYPAAEKVGIRVCKEALKAGCDVATARECYCLDAAFANHYPRTRSAP